MDSEFIETAKAPVKIGRVLVVDDDRSTRTIHRACLSDQFDVEIAISGEQALSICQQSLPDLVVLDVMMPAMDRYETCKKLREFTDIPIIFATIKCHSTGLPRQ